MEIKYKLLFANQPRCLHANIFNSGIVFYKRKVGRHSNEANRGFTIALLLFQIPVNGLIMPMLPYDARKQDYFCNTPYINAY